ncbi:hypothetical protein BC829DRAFT_414542 [Chytridium lagenaria]|nr:hypothetical protein BC829DRAFT_414542 [Chytridium lagenaria]
MGKKQRRSRHVGHVEGRESFARMNFLFQAASLCTLMAARKPVVKNVALTTNDKDVKDVKDGDGDTTMRGEQTVDRVEKKEMSGAVASMGTSKKRPPRKGRGGLKDLNGMEGLARFYSSALKRVGRKTVLENPFIFMFTFPTHRDPNIKRSICKRCDTVLIPGVSSTIRTEDKPELIVAVHCKPCGFIKRFPCRPDHTLFTEKAAVRNEDDENDGEDGQDGE